MRRQSHPLTSPLLSRTEEEQKSTFRSNSGNEAENFTVDSGKHSQLIGLQ